MSKQEAEVVPKGIRGVWLYIGLTALMMFAVLMLLILYGGRADERTVAAVGIRPAGTGIMLRAGEAADTYLSGESSVRVEATGLLLLDGHGSERDYFLYDFKEPIVIESGGALVVADRLGRDLSVLEPSGRFTGITGTTNAVASFYRDGVLIVLGEDSAKRVILTRYDLPEAKAIFELRPSENEVVMKATISPDSAFIDVLCYDRQALELKHVVRRYAADGTFLTTFDVGNDTMYSGLVYTGDDLALLGAKGVVILSTVDGARKQHYPLKNARGLWNTGERLVALADGDDGQATLFLLADDAVPIYRFNEKPVTMPDAAAGYVAVVDGGRLILLDAGGGDPLSIYEIDEPIRQIALTASGQLLVLTENRLLPFTLR